MRQQMPPGEPLGSKPDSCHEKFFRDPAFRADAPHDAVVQYFIEARHGRHQRRRHLDEIVRDLIGAFAIPDLTEDLEGKVHAGGVLI